MRENIDKIPLFFDEIVDLVDYLSLDKEDPAKDSAWTLAFLAKEKSDFLRIAEKICDGLEDASDDDFEKKGMSSALWFFLKNNPDRLNEIILRVKKNNSQKIKEEVANIAFYIDQFEGVKQWAQLYAHGKNPYHPWDPFQMTLYYEVDKKLMHKIHREIKDLELEKNCDKNLLETYKFFEKVVSDGLKKREGKNK